MKNSILFTSILFLFLSTGCFEDEGKYDYLTLNVPVWQLKSNENMAFTCRAGEIAIFRASPYFKWEGDSAKRASEVRYEWKLNGVVIGEEADFDVPTDTLIRKINLEKFDNAGVFGTFSIIEKETGIAYMWQTWVTFLPRYASMDWIVLSEKGGNAKCSFVKRQVDPETKAIYFELDDDTYAHANGGDIPGKPWMMCMNSGATNISSLGSVSVFTDQVIYDVSCENMMKVGELKDDFLSMPANFEPRSRLDLYGGRDGFSGVISFVTTQGGRIFTKQMTKNNLGGKFLTEPIVVDAKGYKITRVGPGRMGFSDFPCYDELNRRVLMCLFYDSGDGFEMMPGMIVHTGDVYTRYKFNETAPAPGLTVTGCAKVWDMPEGTEVLYAAYNTFVPGGMFVYYHVYSVLYNDANGNTRLTDFTYDPNTGHTVQNAANQDIAFPGGNLDKNSIILTSGYEDYHYPKNKYILYSKGNGEIRYVNKNNYSDKSFLILEDASDKITCMSYGVNGFYQHLVVGTEKGKLIYYDVADMTKAPKQVASFDMGGRMVACKEMSNEYNTNKDLY